MEKTVGYAVVGLGVGRNHVKAAAKAEGGKLVAICDLREERLQAQAELYPGVKTYTSFEEMLKNPEIDVVSICTPSGMHADMAIQALRAGKHVLTEKPMDIVVDKIYEIDKVAKECGKKVGCIFQNRRNAIMEPMKKAVDAGRLGEIYTGFFRVNWYRSDEYFLESGGWRGTWAMDGGGSLMNQAVHTVDLMQWLLGDVASIRSDMRIVNHKIETEDFTSSVIKFKSGAIVTFVSTTAAYPGFGTDIQVTGTKGSIHVDGDKLIAWRIAGENMKEEEAEMLAQYGNNAGAIAAADNTIVRGHDFMVQDMIDAVRFDRDPFVGPLEAVKAVRIINAVYESARTGKEIVF
mgnify:CR=1 FL=1